MLRAQDEMGANGHEGHVQVEIMVGTKVQADVKDMNGHKQLELDTKSKIRHKLAQRWV